MPSEPVRMPQWSATLPYWVASPGSPPAPAGLGMAAWRLLRARVLALRSALAARARS